MPNNEAFSGRASETRVRLASQPGAGALETLTTLRDWGLKLGAISNTVQPARYMHQAHIRRGLPCASTWKCTPPRSALPNRTRRSSGPRWMPSAWRRSVRPTWATGCGRTLRVRKVSA